MKSNFKKNKYIIIMSRTKDLYFEHFATYDYLDMPNHDFELDWRTWKMKEDRLEKMNLILDKLENKIEELCHN